ncbi:MAG TPA: c-type cytochrome [Ktedonobacterales bacterium]|jgi:plastocyanin/mono/diheme cytochrome c family protein|nr:c-type cytochrome [Ktedonobacterales bacterium]
MEGNRNPGLLAVTVGVGLAVLFAVLGVTSVLQGRIAFGLAVVSLGVAALVYVFYSRGNAVTKTGYAALIVTIAVGLILPFLLVSQQQTQVDAQAAQYDLTLQRGAALFGQYCATCHGYQGQGLNGPKLNNNPAVNSLTDEDLTRIISGGIANPNDPSKLLMPAWLNTYGGSLTQDDINYLVAFIRSSDPKYTASKGLPSTNGFSYVYDTLINATQQAEFKIEAKGGSKPPATNFVDKTTEKTVTIDAVDSTTNSSGYDWQIAGGTSPDIIIKAGTTVVWDNQSTGGIPHSVVSGSGGTPNNKFPTSPIFSPGGSYSYTFTTPGEYPYYCGVHPAMVGWITVQ